jgi:hypothetical protein
MKSSRNRKLLKAEFCGEGRMKKASYYVLTVLLVIAGLIVAAHSQDEMEFVGSEAFMNPQRTPSVFFHEEHNETAEIYDCNECHHVYEDGVLLEDESSEDMMCSECHELKAVDNAPGLRLAFHTNCKGCHLDRKKGPVMCGECHRK